jgi:hypothetical protein
LARASRFFLFPAFFPAFFFGLFFIFRPQCLHKLVRLLLRGVFHVAVVMLNLSNELLAPAVDDVDIVIGELAPLFLDLAFVLLPFALNLIPVHDLPPWTFAAASG